MDIEDESIKQYRCGYCGRNMNSYCKDYLQHECFARVIENNPYVSYHVMADEHDALTLESLPEDNEETTGYEEVLIAEVCRRRPLWDHRTPARDRHKLKIGELWQEIYNVLEGKKPIEDLKKRWRQLRDGYMRAKKKMKQYSHSGSEGDAVPTKPGFSYYESMQFLDDVLDLLPTESNCKTVSGTTSTSGSTSAASSSTSASSSTADSPAATLEPPAKKQKFDRNELQLAILKSLEQPRSQPDGVDGFLLMVGEKLRQYPVRKRNQMEIHILTLLQEAAVENLE